MGYGTKQASVLLRIDLWVLGCGNYFLIAIPFTFCSYYFWCSNFSWPSWQITLLLFPSAAQGRDQCNAVACGNRPNGIRNIPRISSCAPWSLQYLQYWWRHEEGGIRSRCLSGELLGTLEIGHENCSATSGTRMCHTSEICCLWFVVPLDVIDFKTGATFIRMATALRVLYLRT